MYTLEPSCANHTNITNRGREAGDHDVEVGSGIVATCFNSTHTCSYSGESTGNDGHDEFIAMIPCYPYAYNTPCWEGTDSLLFSVSFLLALLSLIAACTIPTSEKEEVRC